MHWDDAFFCVDSRGHHSCHHLWGEPAARKSIFGVAQLRLRNLLLTFLVLASASPAFANWTVVQQTASPQVQSTSVTVQFPSAVTAGDMILVHVIWATNGNTSVSDSLGNTYNSAAVAQGSTSVYQISSQIFYAANILGGQDRVTVTTSTSTFLNFYIYEISGAVASNPLDVTAAGNGTGLSLSTSSVATTSPSDFVFVGTAHHYASDSTNPGFVGMIATPTGMSEYQVANLSGTAVSGSGTLTDTNPTLPWAEALAAFKMNTGSGGGGGPSLTAIQVTPFSPTLGMGQSLNLSAIGTFSDGSTQNVSSSVVWSTASPTIASISSSGLATAVGHGTTTITATSGSISGGTPLTVEGMLTSIQVTPSGNSILMGTAQQFTATGTFSDGTTENLTAQATWTSSNTSVATINSSGLATGITAGTSTITATSGAVTGSTALAVTQPIIVTPPPTSGSPLVQTNYQWESTYFAQVPPTSGLSACSPAPCIAQTFLNPNTAGNLIFVWVSWNTSSMTFTGISDTAGNTYVQVPGFPSSGGTTDDFFVAYNVNGSANNKVTANFSGSAVPIYMQILEYSGLATSNALDVSSTIRKQAQCVAPCSISTNPTPKTSQASELLVAVFDVGGNGQLTTGPGWSSDASCAGCLGWETDVSGQVVIEHQLVSTTGSFTATITDAMSGWPAYDGYLFTFKLHP